MREDNTIEVKLKPIFGIRPGIYLAVLYSLVLLMIVFFLFIFPGIKNPGAILTVKTEPAGAAIRVNDVYMGLAGSRIFVSKGTHTIEAVMPGFESKSAVHTIPGSGRYKTEFTLETSDPAAAFAVYAADFATWTFIGEPTAAWQIPMSLSDGAYRVGPYADRYNEELLEIWKTAVRFTVTRAALRDVIRSKILLDNHGNAPAVPALLGSIFDILTFLSQNPGCINQLCDLLPTEAQSILLNYIDIPQNPSLNTGRSGFRRQNIAGLTFTEANNFFISENHVSRSIFDTFLNQNPQWEEHLTEYFSQEITVSPSAFINRSSITGITWYAADAFCKWLSLRLPVSMSGMEVRLPTEAEWDFAVLNGIISAETSGWEWCSDPYAPLQFLTVSAEAARAVGSPEYSLRGRPSLQSEITRASLPPDLSSPFVTFRPVIAEKK